MNIERADVCIVGGGPAGMRAAIEAKKSVKRVVLIEMNENLGGVLPQCIHSGFIDESNVELTGPEYAWKLRKKVETEGVDVKKETYIANIEKERGKFIIRAVNRKGVLKVKSRAIVFATGCRERTRGNIMLPGNRVAGIYTAGVAQMLVNKYGLLPGKKVAILGSGDIGLVMACTLALEGAEVVGIFEIKPMPSGTPKNVALCKEYFNIPVHLGTTVSFVHGKGRVEGISVVNVDGNMKPLKETERYVECDALLLSVGLIPEVELLKKLGAEIDGVTKGAKVNQFRETGVDGVFACGNCLHVHDVVGNAAEEGKIAGMYAALYSLGKYRRAREHEVKVEGNVRYVVPQRISEGGSKVIMFSRVKFPSFNSEIIVTEGGRPVFMEARERVDPPRMERMEFFIKNGRDVKVRI